MLFVEIGVLYFKGVFVVVWFGDRQNLECKFLGFQFYIVDGKFLIEENMDNLE